jgi:hypothetical protein
MFTPRVIMDQDVPKSGNGSPVDLGMERFHSVADPLCGFCEGLEIAQNGVLNQFRLAKRRLTVLAIPADAADTLEDVMNVEEVILHKGIAS